MEKCLPFEIPFITSYPKYAYRLAALMAFDNYIPYLYSNFIQLTFEGKKELDFYTPIPELTPFLISVRIPKQTLGNLNINLIDFILDMINQDCYMVAYLNEFHIPDSPVYQKYDFPHSIFIYGYNKTKQVFNTAGFFNNFKFQTSQASFDQIIQAFDYNISPGDYWEYYNFIKIKTDAIYQFNIQCILELLEDYLSSNNTSEKNKIYATPTTDNSYGLSIYGRLKEYTITQASQKLKLRQHSFHLLWEHKICMHKRVLYLMEHGILPKKYDTTQFKIISNQALIIRNLMIKYNINMNSSVIDKIIEGLDKLFEVEKEVLTQLVNEIKHSTDHTQTITPT